MPKKQTAGTSQKKQMLVVLGPGSCGKSTSIKLAYESMLQRACRKRIPVNAAYCYFTQREVAVHLNLSNPLGIASKGDNAYEVLRGLDFFSQHKSKVIICATRPRGPSYLEAMNFAEKNGFFVTELEKEKASADDWEAENRRMAKKIHAWACKRAGT